MSWRAVTFYTGGTGYEREAQRLIASAKSANVALKVYAYPNLGSWRANLNYKSQAILTAFDEFPGQDIVFIDADAIVRSYPSLFDTLSAARDHDIAAHFLRDSELLSGTLWIAGTERGRQIVQAWHDAGKANAQLRHQVCLHRALLTLAAHGFSPKVYRLPIEYTCIFDHPSRRGKAAVIEHFQASRKYRQRINLQPMRRPQMAGPFNFVDPRRLG